MAMELGKTLDALIPKTLDQIITRNRALCSLHLSSDDDIAHLQRIIVATEQDAKDVIRDWRIVCIDRPPEHGGKDHILLGYAQKAGVPWSTSVLVGIDLVSRSVLTTSGSLYRLAGEKAQGEPPFEHVLQMCRTLTQWGVGRLLGVLEVF